MTDRTNVITVTQDNLAWINENVPGASKQKRLEEMLRFYKERRNDPVVALTKEDHAILMKIAEWEGCSVNETIHRRIQGWGP